MCDGYVLKSIIEVKVRALITDPIIRAGSLVVGQHRLLFGVSIFTVETNVHENHYLHPINGSQECNCVFGYQLNS